MTANPRSIKGVHGPHRRLRTIGGTIAAVALLSTGCSALGLGGAQFEVGDCVRIQNRILDSKLDAASCEGAVGTFDQTERVYRVDSVLDHTHGGCPQLAGFFPVEFVHEPDGVTYCLVQES